MIAAAADRIGQAELALQVRRWITVDLRARRSVHQDVRPDRVVLQGLEQIGVPYRWGGMSPETGFDCSGLVSWLWAQQGVSLPHFAAAQYALGWHVDASQLEIGDLVFFHKLGHVGIYVGPRLRAACPASGRCRADRAALQPVVPGHLRGSVARCRIAGASSSFRDWSPADFGGILGAMHGFARLRASRFCHAARLDGRWRMDMIAGAGELEWRIACQTHWRQAAAVRDGRQSACDPDGESVQELGDGFRRLPGSGDRTETRRPVLGRLRAAPQAPRRRLVARGDRGAALERRRGRLRAASPRPKCR